MLPVQIVDLPLAAGLDESADIAAGKPGTFRSVENLEFREAGALSRRDGSTALPVAIVGPGLFPAIDHLEVHGRELLAIGSRVTTEVEGDPLDGGPYLWSWGQKHQRWAPVSQVSPCTWRVEPMISVADVLPADSAPAWVAVANGLEVAVWATPNGDGASMMARVRDVASGAILKKDEFTGLINGRVVVFSCGGKVIALHQDASRIQMRKLDTSDPDLEWSGDTTILDDLDGLIYWDACPVNSSYFALVSTNGDVETTLRKIDLSGTTAFFETVTSNGGICTVASDGTTIAAVGVESAVGINVWSREASGGALDYNGTVFLDTDLDFIERISACLDSERRVWVAVDARKTIVGPTSRQMLLIGSLNSLGDGYGEKKKMAWTAHLARPFPVGDSVFLLVSGSTFSKPYPEDVQWGAALLDISAHPWDITSDRPVSLVGLLPSFEYQSYYSAEWRHAPFAVERESGEWVAPLEIATGEGDVNRDWRLGVWQFGVSSGLWRSAAANGGLCLSGGCTGWYDGYSVAELGFAHPPINYSIALNEPAATAAANASYLYAATWHWTDGRGLSHESEPCPLLTAEFSDDLIGVGGASATLIFHGLQITRKGDLEDGRVRRPRLRVYRTLKNDPSAYYLLADPPYSVSNETIITVTDSETDADLLAAERGVLYTVGGRLEHRPPPPSCAAVQAKRRLWVASTAAPEVWFSGELQPGEGPWFHEVFSVRLEGDEPIVALAILDEKVIVFTAGKIYAIIGDGPNDKGEGAFPQPQLICSSSGCVDARSVVVWKGGVFFLSAEGLALLDRGLAVTFAGVVAKSTIEVYPAVTGATLDAKNERCLWCVEAVNGTGKILWFDYGAGAWGTFAYLGEEESNVVQRSQCIWNGLHVRSHGGEVWMQDPDSHRDGSLWIPASLQTHFQAFASLSGAQRVRRVVVSGERFSGANWQVLTYFDESQEEADTISIPKTIVGSRETRIVAHLSRQKGTSFAFRLEEVVPDPVPVSLGLTKIRGLGLEVGVKPGTAKVIPSRRV